MIIVLNPETDTHLSKQYLNSLFFFIFFYSSRKPEIILDSINYLSFHIYPNVIWMKRVYLIDWVSHLILLEINSCKCTFDSCDLRHAKVHLRRLIDIKMEKKQVFRIAKQISAGFYLTTFNYLMQWQSLNTVQFYRLH